MLGLVVIDAGTFEIGCTASQADCDDDELPVTTVTLTRSYWLDQTETTVGAFEALMGYNPARRAGCAACPVEQVSWHEAAAYTNALTAQTGEGEPCFDCQGEGAEVVCALILRDPYSCTGYRLPTEAEWEHAARCGTDQRYAGSGDADAVAWSRENSDYHSWMVAQKAPNGCELYDMSGNVAEWVWDWRAPYPGGAITDPAGPSSVYYRANDYDPGHWFADRVFRGGSWWEPRSSHRVSERNGDPSRNRYDAIGDTWGTAALVETDNTGEALYPNIALHSGGHGMAVWYQSDGSVYNATASRYDAVSGFAAATTIETDNAGDAMEAQVAVGPQGRAIAIWSQSNGLRKDIRANRFE